jgi:predicted Zn-dependent protease
MRLPIIFLTIAVMVAMGQKSKDDVSKIGDRNVGNCLNFYSLEKEIALGKQLAEEVARQSKLYLDPIVEEKINRIGQNLVRNSDSKLPFTFRVVDDDVPNAFSLPGGFVFVNTGLIKLASEESELAGAMAHEVAHVAARHMTCQATKSQVAGIAATAGGVLLGGGLGGYAGRQAAGVATQTAFLKLSRGAETEADYLGTQYMYAAGYDPNGAISIFEKMESLRKKKAGALDRIFSTHPMDADRIDKTQKEIQRILPAKSEYVVNTSEYMDVRDRVISRSKTTFRPDGNLNEDRPTLKRRELVQ